MYLVLDQCPTIESTPEISPLISTRKEARRDKAYKQKHNRKENGYWVKIFKLTEVR